MDSATRPLCTSEDKCAAVFELGRDALSALATTFPPSLFLHGTLSRRRRPGARGGFVRAYLLFLLLLLVIDPQSSKSASQVSCASRSSALILSLSGSSLSASL